MSKATAAKHPESRAHSPPRPRKRQWRAKTLLLAVSVGFAVLLGEAALRLTGGYRLFGLRLHHVLTEADGAVQVQFHSDLVEPFVASIGLDRSELDPSWIATSPRPLKLPPALDQPLLDQSQWLLHYYVTNEALLRAYWVKGAGLPMLPGIELPDEFDVFSPPGNKITPRYRYPSSRLLPTGLITNAFGFRGRELDVDKPDNTVRIGFVGASTTVEMAALPHSAPELIEHWLGLWARARGLDVRFETLNAAREAIQSSDIRAIVEDELLPLAVDYVVYYEGANQLPPDTMLQHVRIEDDYQLASPPPGLVGTFDGAETTDTTWLDRLSDYSATARYLRSALRGSEPLAEPTKPPQTVVLPEGVGDDPFPLETAGQLLQLGAIGADLEAIRESLAAIRAQLVLCTFCWLAHDGLTVDPVFGHNIHVQLNRSYWPFLYTTIQQLAAVQNRFYRAFAEQHGLDLIDIAELLPRDERLFLDAIHQTELGVRIKAWVLFARLTEILRRDLVSQRVPVPDMQLDATHPNIGPVKTVSRAELDQGR